MSTTKASGTSRNGRDSNPQYLGVKLYDGQKTKPGSIIVRQRGSKIMAGKNVKIGRDHTLYAIKEGTVKYQTKKFLKFNGLKKTSKVANVI